MRTSLIAGTMTGFCLSLLSSNLLTAAAGQAFGPDPQLYQKPSPAPSSFWPPAISTGGAEPLELLQEGRAAP
jgi:hypothetical protein